MKKPKFQILICNSYRLAGESQGACNKKEAPLLIQYAMEGISDRGLDAVVTGTGCLNVCTNGPVMVVQPNNLWYGGINESVIDEILDSLENQEPTKNHLISE
jgi:(2Fe-2S) ferredoxin